MKIVEILYPIFFRVEPGRDVSCLLVYVIHAFIRRLEEV